MFEMRCLFTIILFTYSIKFSGAKHEESRMVFNYLNFEKIKIDLFTMSRTTEVFDYRVTTRNDEECMVELNEIGRGVKNLELWAIKRKN